MSKILVIAEHLGGKLNPSTARAVSAASAVKPEALDVLVLSDAPDAVAAEAAKIAGVSRVLTITRSENTHPLAAVLAPQIAKAAESYSHVFVPSTTFGKDVAPRVAALIGVAQVSDVMSVEGSHTFKRPIYAGNAIITVEADPAHTVVATIRTASWAAAVSGANSAPIEALTVEASLPTHTRFIELRQGSSDRPDLQSASKVVSGGRGVGSKENFDIIYKFADKIGAAVGASRAAVDAGYCPNEMQ
ncbi:MAG TPA: FAD-binding protein, partial [Rhodanobacter sp.]|nr:FAD-binding protein [Rhodanobacter sp.]